MIMIPIYLGYIVIVAGIIGYIAENFISARFGDLTAIIFVLVASSFMSLPLISAASQLF